jgi:hypothetical protein
MATKLHIYAGEAERIARWTEEYRDAETGGELYGLYLPSGAFVVLLATGPGPRARRTATSFFQDADVFRRTTRHLFETHALQCGGSWHSHHSLSLAEPSGGDSATVVRAMERHDVSDFTLVIANLSNAEGRPDPRGLATLRGFGYRQEDGERYESLTWVELPGESPIRSSRASREVLDEPRLSRTSFRLSSPATASSVLRSGSWALRPEGVDLLQAAKSRLATVGRVQIRPSPVGLLEMHVSRGADRWTVTFHNECTAEESTAWLERAESRGERPRYAGGDFYSVVGVIAGLIESETRADTTAVPADQPIAEAAPVISVRPVASPRFARLPRPPGYFEPATSTRPAVIHPISVTGGGLIWSTRAPSPLSLRWAGSEGPPRTLRTGPIERREAAVSPDALVRRTQRRH